MATAGKLAKARSAMYGNERGSIIPGPTQLVSFPNFGRGLGQSAHVRVSGVNL